MPKQKKNTENKLKERTRLLNPQIYPVRILVTFNYDAKWLTDNYDCVNFDFNTPYDQVKWFQDLQNSDFGGLTSCTLNVENNNKTVVISFPDRDVSPGEIAHEASHAVKAIFNHIGIDCDVHEPFEYMLGWLVDEIYKVKLENKPIRDI